MIGKLLNNQNDKLKGLVISIILLNTLDGILTIGWVEMGRATEINPLMDQLISIHPVLFMAIKMLLVCLGVLLLWRFRYKTMAVASLYLCFTAYSILILYHGAGLVS
ncbi:MAG: DUF5658 family protein [Pseudomonadota bacterium]